MGYGYDCIIFYFIFYDIFYILGDFYLFGLLEEQ
jgi:hypothetical protein